MLPRFALVIAALLSCSAEAHARRVALVIGQTTYTAGLSSLPNPANDARRVAALLAKHGFDVISCDGKLPGCFDLSQAGMLTALAKLTAAAKEAVMALVYFAGHGLATGEGNILTPTDARALLTHLATEGADAVSGGAGGSSRPARSARPLTCRGCSSSSAGRSARVRCASLTAG